MFSSISICSANSWNFCAHGVLFELAILLLLTSKSAATEPNVFFVTDDTPAAHRLGRITHFDGYQHGILDSTLFKAVLVRANRPPAVFFKLDEHKGDLFTKVVMDREILCSNDLNSKTVDTNFGKLTGRNLMLTSPNWNSLSSSMNEALTLRRSNSDECELKFQIALHRKTSTPSVQGLPEFLDIRVVIMDRNDHVPTFHPNKFANLSIPESAQIGTRIRLPLAIDPDSPEFSIKRYKLFPVDQKEWTLYQQTADVLYRGHLHQEITALFLELRGSLDREQHNSFEFEVRAYDSNSESTTSDHGDRNVLKVNIFVEDINDNGPVFNSQSRDSSSNLDISHPVTYRAKVMETTWPKAPIMKLEATDRDTMNYAIVRYDFAPHVDSLVRQYFKLNEHSGELYLRQPLDYETQSRFTFNVLAIDSEHDRRMKLEGMRIASHSGGTQSDMYTSTACVIVEVEDLNDEVPVIELDYLRLDESSGRPATFAVVQENSDPPQFVADLLVTDRDVNPANNHVICTLKSAELSRSQFIDHSINESHLSSESSFQLSEVRRQSGQVQYNLLTLRSLDREEQLTGESIRHVQIMCVDSGAPSKTSQVAAHIHVLDVNDNAPVIHAIQSLKSHSTKSNTLTLYENSPVGTLVARINVTDKDIGKNGLITCKLIHPKERSTTTTIYADYFHIEPTTCDLVTRRVIDREAIEPYIEKVTLILRVEDQGTPPKQVETNLDIIILDENDNPPVLQQSYYRLTVRENLPAGTCIGQLVVYDLDGTYEQLTARFQKHDDLPFHLWRCNSTEQQLEQLEGRKGSVIYYLNTTKPLDREVKQTYEFNVIVTDGWESSNPFSTEHQQIHTTTATVFVMVEDENDNDPNIIFPQQENKTFYLSNSEQQHYQLMTVNANDKDSNDGQFLFSLLDETSNLFNESITTKSGALQAQHIHTPFLDIDQRLGTVYLTRDTMEKDTGLYAFKVIVQDDGTPPRSASLRFFVRVDPTPPRSYRPHISSSLNQNNQQKLNAVGRLTKQQNGVSPHYTEDDVGSVQKLSEQKWTKATSVMPRFTGDAVLILSLGLILLLLLATLCLIIYARHWNTPRRTRPEPNQDNTHTLTWFCTHLCDRESISGVPSKEKEFSNSPRNIHSKPNISSPIHPSVQTYYLPENVGTPQSHDTVTDILDDSTLQRIYTGDRVYYQDCRPVTLIPLRSTSRIDGHNDGYTTLQANTRFQSCGVSERHRSSSVTGGSGGESEREVHSLSDPLNTNQTPYTPLMKRVQSPYIDKVISSQPTKRRNTPSSFPCCESECVHEKLHSNGYRDDVELAQDPQQRLTPYI